MRRIPLVLTVLVGWDWIERWLVNGLNTRMVLVVTTYRLNVMIGNLTVRVDRAIAIHATVVTTVR